MSVSVIVPFRSDDGIRKEIWDWVGSRWSLVYPDFELVVADSDDEEFSRSQARNNAFNQSSGDIIIVADADSVPLTNTILGCIDVVQQDPTAWLIAHSSYMMLREESTRGLLDQLPSVSLATPSSGSLVRPPFVSYAGMLVMHREAYKIVGGYDERFVGWGLEDWAFRLAMDTLINPFSRLPGALIHLYHGPPNGDDFGVPPSHHNAALFEKFKAASGNVAAMRELVNNA